MIQVKFSQAMSIVAKCIRAKLVPMIRSSPGIGKSSIGHSVSEQYKLKMIDVRLAQCDPTDINGFPTIEGDRAGYRPMDTFPIEGDEIPEGYNGWLLFLDEFSSAPLAVQAAAYKLVLDRMIGKYKLHKNVAIVCAGNMESDNAIVIPMSTALQSRLVHLELVSDVPEWLDWAYGHGIDHRITSYIKFKPGQLYNFSPDHNDETYACNRTWEFADRVMKVTDDVDKDRLPMLAGTLSEGVAREFIAFCKIDNDLPKIPEIVQNPDKIRVPTEPSIVYALTGSIGHHASKDNIGQLIKYIKRLPKEFQVVTLREIVRRNRDMMKVPALLTWIDESAFEIYA